ncbi:MAG: acetyl-CoA acetyltransferase [Deltaproteobacteria bacterium RIFCSPLOWO2_02_FULL_50_16]|nr:MAG: acetyl-CoA acetyltransferase [Deltaproteobacteria bacterium RIFCSPHIGHO2_02_FULL_50_15]OGQ56575.1 MAG: acetyl-CoA acetyltransferase [Deltaproteobacteria bacterium RIFCSPLOWO2_02_FULL_50_16]OGQ65564.1 MAG: acetyl-CoA acetyltransferase [Deltaproteobacteria bacterium RIFCSPLOWO2_12_FULL_50_11]
MSETVIVAARRTPIGSFQGALSSLSAPQLGSLAIKACLEKGQVPPEAIDDVIMGNVLTAGVGQAPARQAALGAGLPQKTTCLTLNKVCGSGLMSVALAHQMIQTGASEGIVAGGQESMTQTPYLLPDARAGYRLGHQRVVDGIIKDGLWDVYNDFHMGNAAELCAREKNCSRQDQDRFALESYHRARRAIKEGYFKEEITPVSIPSNAVRRAHGTSGAGGADPKGETIVDTDEEPMKADLEKLPTLKPAFQKDGTVTAGNASSLNDGAAAVILMSASRAQSLHLKPMAKILGYATVARAPEWFTMAPSDAIEKNLSQLHLKTSNIDLFEINEAFSVVSLCNMAKLHLDPQRVNIHGGAVALGHPIGASGTRILVTLLHALKRTQGKKGLASLCIGGGEAISMVIEMC